MIALGPVSNAFLFFVKINERESLSLENVPHFIMSQIQKELVF